MSHQDYYKTKYWSALNGWSPSIVTYVDPVLAAVFQKYLRPDDKLLDVGCGNGGHYGKLVRPLVEWHCGIDLSIMALREAKQVGIEALQSTADQCLPFAEESFDAAACIEVFEHLFDPAAVAREIYRILKPQGYLIATVPNIAHFPHRLRLLGGKFVAGGSPPTAYTPWIDPHIRFFTKRSFIEMLRTASFAPVHVVGIDAGILTDFPILSVVLKRLFGKDRVQRASSFLEKLAQMYPPLFAGHLIAVCKKPE